MNQLVDSVDLTLIPAATLDWFSWLSREEAKTVAAYLEKPALLIADFHRERAITRDYEGRELLELLQNANDQAAEAGIPGRVVFELHPEGLVVANTGLPFSTAGVSSLQTSHLSPKRKRRNQVIGNKGLGFRSVLNWSHTPIIMSGGLRLAFSVRHAESKLSEMMAANVELAKLVREEKGDNSVQPLPILPFPLFDSGGDLAPNLLNEPAVAILHRCQDLVESGFDTAIGMPFDQPLGLEAALAQLDELRPEILLFAKHLGELSFRLAGEPDKTWKRDKVDERVLVLCNEEPLGSWRVFRKEEILPFEARDADHGDPNIYEIVVAVPHSDERIASPLFCHFPTDVEMPLAVVCHASLELEQNRKQIQTDRKSNAYVLGKLAEFLAEIAERIASEPGTDPWNGCSILMPLGEFPGELRRASFSSQLTRASRLRAVVPTLAGAPVKPSSARLVHGADASWLPAHIFPDVVPIQRGEQFIFLQTLEVPRLSETEIKQRVIDHPELSLEERIALIVGLLQHQIHSSAFTSALLIDCGNNAIADSTRVFIAPTTGDIPDLPDWLDLRVLREDMRNGLAESLGTRDNRELQQRLAGFGLVEYSLASIISSLVASANRAVKFAPERAEYLETELLRLLLSLYRAEGPANKRPDYPERSPVRLRNQLGQSAYATTLYLGRGFGSHGEIVQSLFEPWAPEKLVSAASVHWLTTDSDSLKQFLLWIGVCEWPRDEIVVRPPPAYRDFLLANIDYPARFGEFVFESREKVASPSVRNARSIDGIDGILTGADSHAIAAWLSLDTRVSSWQRWEVEHAELACLPGQSRNDRQFLGALPNYVRWLLESSPWLLLPTGERIRPKDCVLGERALDALFPRPAMPNKATLATFGVDQSDLIEGWRRAGVLTSLAYLERDEIYAKLLELPQRSPDGKLARPLYQWLLDASDIAIGDNGINHNEFVARGKMWGRFGDKEGYFLVSELHHADAEGLPEVLLQHLKVVDLRKRVGAEKVERLLGVRPIDRAEIEQRCLSYQPAVGSNEADSAFQRTKPFFHKLRTSQTSQVANLQTLKEIQLVVCSELRAAIAYAGATFDYDVAVWGWLIDGKTLFVRADPASPIELSDDLLADAVGEALASIFRIGDGGDFARMLLCGDKDRLQLLRKMRGDSILEDIDTVRAEFADFHGVKPVEAKFPVAAPPVASAPMDILNDPSAAPESPLMDSLPKIPDAIAPPAGPSEPPALPTSLEVTREVHVVAPAPVKQKLRVVTVLSPPSPTIVVRRVTDGDFCEKKAMEFEEFGLEPRYPILVSQIVGIDGAGCDILSFLTEEARDAFRAGPKRDLNSVARFIEVKGRGNSAASIELRGNELAAAENYGQRYFIYRLFEAETGGFQLAILNNPLKEKGALQPAVHVAIDRATGTEKFFLSGGISK